MKIISVESRHILRDITSFKWKGLQTTAQYHENLRLISRNTEIFLREAFWNSRAVEFHSGAYVKFITECKIC